MTNAAQEPNIATIRQLHLAAFTAHEPTNDRPNQRPWSPPRPARFEAKPVQHNHPLDTLTTYCAWLEKEHGFASTWIRTDYRFESLSEAQEATQFFFGDELADQIARENWVILPECTGLWWLTV
jgi:hypothetical protein